jgi:hypothetical protein
VVKERLRELSDRFTGAQAITLRQKPIPWAYRVFFRHIGLDPDVDPKTLPEILFRLLFRMAERGKRLYSNFRLRRFDDRCRRHFPQQFDR